MRLLVLSSVILCGCATTSQTHLPDGRPGYSIDCSGSALSWSQCEQAAGKKCKQSGYDVVSRSESDNSSSTVGPFGAYGAVYQKRTMLIACKQ